MSKLAFQNQPLFHCIPGDMPKLFEDFGMWICLMKNHLGGTVPYKDTTPRSFEYFSISTPIAGQAKYKDDKNIEYTVSPGQLLLITPNTQHRYGGLDVLFLEDVICFCGSIADVMLENNILKNGIFELPQDNQIQDIITLASQIAQDKKLIANIKLLNLLTSLTEQTQHHSPAKQHNNRKLESLLNALAKDSMCFTSVEDMAYAYGCGVDQFRIDFRNFTKLLPKDYLDQARILQARQELQFSDLTISEISKKFGFHDQFHFSRVFKKKSGVSPSFYRKIQHNKGKE